MKFVDIKIGEAKEFSRYVSREDVLIFAELSGDKNKLHIDQEFGKKSEFGNNLVHGMLVASLLSALVGMYLPGGDCLYLSQSLKFVSPVKPGSDLVVRGEVINKNDSIKVIKIKTEVFLDKKVVISGEAMVKVS